MTDQRFANDGKLVKGKSRKGLIRVLTQVFSDYGFEDPIVFADDAADVLCMDGAPRLDEEEAEVQPVNGSQAELAAAITRAVKRIGMLDCKKDDRVIEAIYRRLPANIADYLSFVLDRSSEFSRLLGYWEACDGFAVWKDGRQCLGSLGRNPLDCLDSKARSMELDTAEVRHALGLKE